MSKLNESLDNIHKHLDNFRVVPRLLLVGYSYLVSDVYFWYMKLEDPTTQQAAFVSTVIGAIPAVLGLYVNSGNKK